MSIYKLGWLGSTKRYLNPLKIIWKVSLFNRFRVNLMVNQYGKIKIRLACTSIMHQMGIGIYISGFGVKECFNHLTLRRPLRKKLRMRWFFDVSEVKESSFLKSDLTDPPQIFDAHLLENTDLSPSRFHFSVGFISRSCFESDGFIAYSNE